MILASQPVGTLASVFFCLHGSQACVTTCTCRGVVPSLSRGVRTKYPTAFSPNLGIQTHTLLYAPMSLSKLWLRDTRNTFFPPYIRNILDIWRIQDETKLKSNFWANPQSMMHGLVPFPCMKMKDQSYM